MSNLARTLRPWHRRVSIIITIPFLITLLTGLALTTREFNPWIRPPAAPTHAPLKVSFDQILDSATLVPEAHVRGWADVTRVDVKPASGVVNVRAKNGWQVQLDAETGAVVGGGFARGAWLVALHEGAYFGRVVRYGVFVPSALGVLGLLVSGVVIYFSSAGASGRPGRRRGPSGPRGAHSGALRP